MSHLPRWSQAEEKKKVYQKDLVDHESYVSVSQSCRGYLFRTFEGKLRAPGSIKLKTFKSDSKIEFSSSR